MDHEYNEKTINVTNSDMTFERLYREPFVTDEIKDDIEKANVLLIPFTGFRGENIYSFPEETDDFLYYLKDNADSSLRPDIAITDNDYALLGLHSAVVTVATILVQSIVLPVIVNLISDYLKKRAERANRGSNELSAEVNIIVEEDGVSKQISYKGPVDGVKEALNTVAQNIFEDSDNSSKVTDKTQATRDLTDTQDARDED